jgi:hypothetical protein
MTTGTERTLPSTAMVGEGFAYFCWRRHVPRGWVLSCDPEKRARDIIRFWRWEVR